MINVTNRLDEQFHDFLSKSMVEIVRHHMVYCHNVGYNDSKQCFVGLRLDGEDVALIRKEIEIFQ